MTNDLSIEPAQGRRRAQWSPPTRTDLGSLLDAAFNTAEGSDGGSSES